MKEYMYVTNFKNIEKVIFNENFIIHVLFLEIHINI
jgi:hypothetical protein